MKIQQLSMIYMQWGGKVEIYSSGTNKMQKAWNWPNRDYSYCVMYTTVV